MLLWCRSQGALEHRSFALPHSALKMRDVFPTTLFGTVYSTDAAALGGHLLPRDRACSLRAFLSALPLNILRYCGMRCNQTTMVAPTCCPGTATEHMVDAKDKLPAAPANKRFAPGATTTAHTIVQTVTSKRGYAQTMTSRSFCAPTKPNFTQPRAKWIIVGTRNQYLKSVAISLQSSSSIRRRLRSNPLSSGRFSTQIQAPSIHIFSTIIIEMSTKWCGIWPSNC